MALPTNILSYLEKQVDLYAEVNPSKPNHHAWIDISYNMENNGNALYLDEKEKYIFRWIEVSNSLYKIMLKSIQRTSKPYKFSEASNIFQKYATDEVELEKLIRHYLEDISQLKPNLGDSSYPFD